MMWLLIDGDLLRKIPKTIYFVAALIIISGIVAYKNGFIKFLLCDLALESCSELYIFSKYCNCYAPEEKTTEERRLNVIVKKAKRSNKILITSLPRSGSSFLGEIFNRQNDVFYFYEPLQVLNALSKITTLYNYKHEAINLLSKFSNCNFEEYQDYFDFLSYPELTNPHFRLMSRVLSKPPFCAYQVHPNSTEEEYRKNCIKINVKVLREHCKSKQFFVIKELLHRIPGVYSQKQFSNYVSLIRDPRAIIWSMMKNKWVEEKGYFASSEEEAIKKVCHIFRSNYFSIINNKNYNADKLLILRYEDLVRKPKKMIRVLFQATNTSIEQGTLAWAEENTHGKSKRNSSSFSVLMRNASYSLSSWRENLKLSSVIEIQDKCGDVMEELGYVLYTSKSDLRDLSISSFVSTGRLKKNILFS